MGLFRIFKKKEVPAELPSLGFAQPHAAQNAPQQPQAQQTPKAPLQPNAQSQSSRVMNLLAQNKQAQIQAPQTTALTNRYKPLSQATTHMQPPAQLQASEPQNDGTGFFKELMKDLTEELNSEKLNTKYKEKILSEDIVNQMKGYWESQKPEVFLKNAGSELKQQLLEKTEHLNNLEKEWQNAYFGLIAQEEKIRQEERELKKMLGELINVYEESLERNKTENTQEVSKKEESAEKE